MSPVLMRDTYKGHTIRITMALAYFVNGNPATEALAIWTVSIDNELLSSSKWHEAGLPEAVYSAATEGDNVTLQGLFAVSMKYIDTLA